MSLCYFLLQTIAWQSVHALKRTNVITGHLVFCKNTLPLQSNPHLERIASKMRNSFCEIVGPLDGEGKVPLCWLGDEQICGAVRRRYLRIVPMVFVHYVEDTDGSQEDKCSAAFYLTEVIRKLNRNGSNQMAPVPGEETIQPLADIHGKSKNLHVILCGQYSFDDYFMESVSENQASGYDAEIIQKVLDRKLVAISHRIHIKMDDQQFHRVCTEEIARDVSPEQSYYPLPRPAFHIHLFPDERSFIRHGGELHHQIMSDPKQIALIYSDNATQMIRWQKYWPKRPRIMCFDETKRLQFMAHCHTLSNPQVLKDKILLSTTIYGLIQTADFEELNLVLKRMKRLPDYQPGFIKMMGADGRICHLSSLMMDREHRFAVPWSDEAGETMNPQEKAKRLDIFMKQWREIVIAELGLRKGDKDGFWKLFADAVRQTLGDHEASAEEMRYSVADAILTMWEIVEFRLDPSYTVNIVLLQGPDMDRGLLKRVCLQHGYSWKVLRDAVEWIDYDSE